MGQNDMEKDFREKLNQRAIQPSAAAWDRLDAMLTVAEGKKTRKPYGWLYVAAGILGFTLLATGYFSLTEEIIDKGVENVVEGESTPNAGQALFPADTLSKPANVLGTKAHQAAERSAVAVAERESGPPTVVPATPHEEGKAAPDIQPQQHVSDMAQTQHEKAETSLPVRSVKVNVDELLASVEKGQGAKFPSVQGKVKVDANGLLSQVDEELDLTFREKAFRAVSQKYQNVRVSLSNRNEE